MIRFLLYKFIQFLILHLPLKVSFAIAQFFSDCQYTFSFKDRRSVYQNLKSILPEEANIQKETREVFRNFGRYLVEFFRMAKDVNKDFLKDHVHVSGQEYLDEAMSKNQGVILVTAHIGNWEMGGALLSLLGYSTAAIALPHPDELVNRLFNQQRENKNVTVISTNASARRSLQHLHKQGLLAIVAERDFQNSGIQMDFLGKQCPVPKGPALFALKTGVPIIPAFIVRSGDYQFDVILKKPIYCHRHKEDIIDESSIKEVLGQYVREIEDIIHQYPSQWLMFREY